MSRPQPTLVDPLPQGGLWRHLNTGDIYVVTGNGFLEASREQAVFYKRADTPDAVVWARSYHAFTDGRFVAADF